jgi:endonuclease/exonuclease/phosphatase (EEP) superfamily protein YafD
LKTAVGTVGRLSLDLLVAAIAVPAVLTLLALGSRWSWLLELSTHFRAHYLVALAVGTIICGFARRAKLAVIFGTLALCNLWFVLRLYLPATSAAVKVSPVRLMSANAYCGNHDFHRLLESVARVSPDVLLVIEFNDAWAAALAPLEASYPYHRKQSRKDCWGIALYSRLPVKQLEVRRIGPADIPSIFAKFDDTETGSFYLVGTHPLAPVRAINVERRNGQLQALAKLVASLDGPVILLGDLNTTSWSPHFRDLVKTSGLRDSRKGFGIQSTWPSRLIHLGIAIDHVLISPEIEVRERTVGPDISSDHRPVIIDLVVPAAGNPLQH